jgi:hypothetical protein
MSSLKINPMFPSRYYPDNPVARPVIVQVAPDTALVFLLRKGDFDDIPEFVLLPLPDLFKVTVYPKAHFFGCKTSRYHGCIFSSWIFNDFCASCHILLNVQKFG